MASGTDATSPSRRAAQLTREQRVALAVQWLEFLGLPVSEARVEQLVPVVMTFHPMSPLGQVANRLVREGAVPTRSAVKARAYEEARRRTPHRPAHTHNANTARNIARKRNPGMPLPTKLTPKLRTVAEEFLTPQVCDRMREAVASTRAEHGTGPTWVELRRHMGWSSKTQAQSIIRAAIAAGVLTGTRQPRSLDIGPNPHVPHTPDTPADATAGTSTGTSEGGEGPVEGDQA